MTDAFRQSELLERLTPYVVPVEARAPHAVVSEWVAQALDKVFTSDSAAGAFAPFSAYFQTPREFRQSFAAMVEVEFAGIALEQMDAVRLVASGVRQALDRRIAGSGRPMLDARRVSPLVFELLSVLFDLDPEQAHRWATRCLFDKVGFSALRSVNDTPVPIELYLVLPMPAFGRTEAGDRFELEVFNWCIENASEPGALSLCLELLPRVLQSQGLGDPESAVSRQADLLHRLAMHEDGDGRTLPEALDVIAWREASLSVGEPTNGIPSPEAIDVFVEEAKKITGALADGLNDRLVALGLASDGEPYSDLLAPPTRSDPAPTRNNTPYIFDSHGPGSVMDSFQVAA
ncbi:hypothetical protein [Stappia sp. ES.058]|uniref:hypothetical protein n=1 Tax=Stappia sp. ES.058 TaxID=1881061 RepID=UPI00087C578C|nr:hypothetical protein [Stappia sp. ES.058]SDU49530.1 hypothetical protein SAMN05428979_4370 [Stappia sp. ES.058]